MGRVLRWFRMHGSLIVSFAVGIIVGVLIRYPAGWVLPDSSANIVGAAAGSVLSVGGAFIVLRSQLDAASAAKEVSRLDALKHFADVVVASLIDTRNFLTKFPGFGYGDVYSMAERLHASLRAAQLEVDSFSNHQFELGLEGTRVFRLVRTDFEAILIRLAAIRGNAALAAQNDDARAECHRHYQGLTLTHNRITNALAKGTGDRAYLDLLAPEPIDA
ncbi:hypothetical protein [Luteibacter sahnii]|uniref:hypothetical protein n=1 Tax=Luteibacter sahnii TaxID=3021977 RepID=UPI002A6A3E58|nr:hypothetical protein [Luteibacter sp. PPL193]MDY1547863.1 hypothetical protein [Luteibacter sp. PPL193]